MRHTYWSASNNPSALARGRCCRDVDLMCGTYGPPSGGCVMAMLWQLVSTCDRGASPAWLCEEGYLGGGPYLSLPSGCWRQLLQTFLRPEHCLVERHAVAYWAIRVVRLPVSATELRNLERISLTHQSSRPHATSLEPKGFKYCYHRLVKSVNFINFKWK